MPVPPAELADRQRMVAEPAASLPARVIWLAMPTLPRRPCAERV
jgi:hypothetical protein